MVGLTGARACGVDRAWMWVGGVQVWVELQRVDGLLVRAMSCCNSPPGLLIAHLGAATPAPCPSRRC